jgi:hypothetical protein
VRAVEQPSPLLVVGLALVSLLVILVLIVPH